LILELKKLHENATLPERATELAGGWDVTAVEIEKVSDNFVICHLGFALAMPEGYKLTLVPRSSLTKTNWVLTNSPGLGDCDYRGEFQLRFRGIPTGIDDLNRLYHKLTYDKFPFEVNERVGQVYLEEVIPMEFKVVEELSETKRGDGGFGSTNEKK
jgi:dUTP pyrophosphatase